MNYFRSIMYLYEYDDRGERGKNVGFVKLSKKETRLKLELRLSGDATLAGEKIYLLDKDHNAMNKVLFGTITEEGPDVVMTRNTGGDGMIKGQLAGVIIGGDGYAVCAGEENESVRIMDFVMAERDKAKRRRQPDVHEPLQLQESRESTGLPEADVKKTDDIVPAACTGGCGGTAGDGQNADGAEQETAQEKGTEETGVQEMSAESGEPDGEGEIIRIELEEEHNAEYMLRKLFATHPNMYPFEDDEMEACVQISPGDFSAFPKEYWHMGSNTFLLQGYYNYRHLILARTDKRFYVGIPGQYHRRDKYLADMFGFGRFKCIQKKPERLGDFGYWMQEVQQPIMEI